MCVSVDWGLLRCLAPVMAGNSEKVPIASAGPEDLQQFMPPVSFHTKAEVGRYEKMYDSAGGTTGGVYGQKGGEMMFFIRSGCVIRLI